MTASTLFQVFNGIALIGWLILIVGVAFNRPFLRDTLAGAWIPIFLSLSYAALIIFFFAQSKGGFDTLENVQKLFDTPWVMLAGWIHYLAFDMIIGARVARQTQELALPRWPLAFLLPLTFLFGPIGYLAFETQKAYTKGTQS